MSYQQQGQILQDQKSRFYQNPHAGFDQNLKTASSTLDYATGPFLYPLKTSVTLNGLSLKLPNEQILTGNAQALEFSSLFRKSLCWVQFHLQNGIERIFFTHKPINWGTKNLTVQV